MGKRRLAAAAWGLLWMAAAGVSPAVEPRRPEAVSVGACKADGTLLGEADILSIGAPGQAPKAKPGSCGS